MAKYVFVYYDKAGEMVSPAGSDCVLMMLDNRWTVNTVHNHIMKQIRQKSYIGCRRDTPITAYSIGILGGYWGDDWMTCIKGITRIKEAIDRW